MDEKKKKLIDKALKRYKIVKPCGNKENLDECFTECNNSQFFWFNTEDNSTRVISDMLNPPVQD